MISPETTWPWQILPPPGPFFYLFQGAFGKVIFAGGLCISEDFWDFPNFCFRVVARDLGLCLLIGTL